MSDQHLARVTFGIKTTPMRVPYEEILRVWQEADDLPEIADAWLWDHLMPVAGPKDGQILEGWTLLSALAARTQRLRLGLLVTSNRIRPPAVLGKIATTVDVISRGRLIMGLGVGGTPQPPNAGGIAGENPAVAEYAAYGLTFVPPPRASPAWRRPSPSSGACGRETFSTSTGATTPYGQPQRAQTRPAARTAAAGRRLGKQDAPPGRRAGRHLEHSRTTA